MSARALSAAGALAAGAAMLATWIVVAGATSAANGAPRNTAIAAAKQSAEPPEPVPPSPTPPPPLPPPPAPPPDAAGISMTTPPLSPASPRPAPTAPGVLWLGSADSTTVHIEIHGDRVYVPVVADGVRRQFLLSTLERSSLDVLAEAPAASADAGGAASSVDGIESPSESVEAPSPTPAEPVATLQIGDIRLAGIPRSHDRVGPFSMSYLGHRADGVLGIELFTRFPVRVDYRAGTMTVFRDEGVAQHARAPDAIIVAIESLASMPAVQCQVDGANASPCLVDVDSDADLMLDWDSAKAQALLRGGPTLSCMREAVPGREVFGRIARAESLSFGGITIGGPLARLPTAAASAAMDPALRQTRIGGGVLSRYVVTVDEVGGSLALSGAGAQQPAKSPFDRSGMWLVVRGDAIVVRNVLPGSPAEAAGLRAGDQVVTLDARPVVDIDDVRAALSGPEGTHVGVGFVRDRQSFDTTVTLRTLI